jgi:hypothetical protein
MGGQYLSILLGSFKNPKQSTITKAGPDGKGTKAQVQSPWPLAIALHAPKANKGLFFISPSPSFLFLSLAATVPCIGLRAWSHGGMMAVNGLVTAATETIRVSLPLFQRKCSTHSI